MTEAEKAAPDPVRVAREAVAATRYGEQDKAAVLNGERDKYPAMELALVGARAMQEAMAQGGEVAPYEAAYRHVKECLHRAEDRAQSAEDALGKVEDLLAEFGAEAPAIIGEYLGERRHAISLARPAPEVKDAPCPHPATYDAGQCCGGTCAQPPTPAPAAASDGLVERARAQNALALEKYGMSIPVLSEMCARIESDAAEKAAKDAEIERLTTMHREDRQMIDAQRRRAEAAEAWVKELDEAGEERWEWEEFERADNIGPESWGYRRAQKPPPASANVRNVKRFVLWTKKSATSDTASDGLVERLRKLAKVGFGYDIKDEDRSALKKAIVRIEAAERQVDELNKECQDSMKVIATERKRAEIAEAKLKLHATLGKDKLKQDKTETIARTLYTLFGDNNESCYISDYQDGTSVTVDGIFNLREMAEAIIRAVEGST